MKTIFASRRNQSGGVLPEARTAPADSSTQEARPILESRPIPRPTSEMFAPTHSPSSPTSLMKLILSARNAFATYLISSAEARSVESNGTADMFSGVADRSVRERLIEDRAGTANTALPKRAIHRRRSGYRLSCKALPSRRNSGFEAAANCGCVLFVRCSHASRNSDSTQFPLPIGTVDLFRTTVNPPFKCWPIHLAACERNSRFGAPDGVGGVHTAINKTSASGIASS